MPQTNTPQTEKKAKLEITLESMEIIEDRVGQWMILEEHWTEHNLNRTEQLSHAKRFYREIQEEIRRAYTSCPGYS
jgi:hypothetical protein